MEEVERIAQKGYIPTEADIIWTGRRTTGITETQIDFKYSLTLTIFDASGQRSERNKWLPSFENVESILFCVDLTSYDKFFGEESCQSRLMETIVFFDSSVNSKWFKRTSIVLLFCNVSRFKQQIQHSPLCNYFPDYTGGDDASSASRYILWRFNLVNRANLRIYARFTELLDGKTLAYCSAVSSRLSCKTRSQILVFFNRIGVQTRTGRC